MVAFTAEPAPQERCYSSSHDVVSKADLDPFAVVVYKRNCKMIFGRRVRKCTCRIYAQLFHGATRNSTGCKGGTTGFAFLSTD